MLQAMGWSHRDAIAFVVVLVAIGAIMANALFMQVGPHPAPMFKSGLLPPPAPPSRGTTAAVQSRARALDPAVSKVEPPPVRPAAEIIADIQRELVRRGFFDGVVDGRHGPRTDAAIRDFELAAGLRPSPEVTEALLTVIRRSNVKAARRTSTASTAAATVPRPPQPVRNDPISAVLAPSKRVLALQRALAEYGYGQIKPTGFIDAETRAAIERFERERKLPVTGEASERLSRELAAVTGRPIE